MQFYTQSLFALCLIRYLAEYKNKDRKLFLRVIWWLAVICLPIYVIAGMYLMLSGKLDLLKTAVYLLVLAAMIAAAAIRQKEK